MSYECGGGGGVIDEGSRIIDNLGGRSEINGQAVRSPEAWAEVPSPQGVPKASAGDGAAQARGLPASPAANGSVLFFRTHIMKGLFCS